MDSTKLALLIARLFQLLCAAVVLGTSVSLYNYINTFAKDCKIAKEPSSVCNTYGLIPILGFGSFAGAFGLLDAIAGIVAAFMEVVPFVIMLGLDALASVVYLASGAALAAELAKRIFNYASGSRYTELKADDAFMFIGLITTIAIIAMTFFWRRSGKLHSTV